MEAQLPEAPEPPPQVPKKTLWLTILTPPSIAVVALTFVVTAPLRSEIAGLAIYLLAMIQAGVIAGLSFHFRDAVAKRYSGVSRAFLVCSYLLGQFIVCLILWVGIALIALMILNRAP